MARIEFWKDKAQGKIDPTLFSFRADALAEQLAWQRALDNKKNKRTQLRKFYDEVLRLSTEAQNRPENWDSVLPRVHMLTAKAAYATGRGLVSDDFLAFMKESVEQIETPKDLSLFADFFEAFMGFYRKHAPGN
ncbi:MAG: type III-A CRISPR-associated protein Csm2 [Desulfomonilaceae bacterium]|nr:type III-A CRISPR-associated protein Csm2 [Desulfomonilaceae bacterium]